MTDRERNLFIPDEHLETYAQDVSHSIKISGQCSGAAIAGEVRRDLKTIARAHDAAALKWQGLASMPGNVRWLLDNHYLARREGLAAAQALPRLTRLRCCGDESLLMKLCRAFLSAGEYRLSPRRLELFLRGFQHSIILTSQELSALEWALRACLVERLALLCRSLETEEVAPEADFESVFSSLRLLSTRDLEPVLEDADLVESTLRQDPAGIYPLMDEATRAAYRAQVSRLARRGTSEYNTARLVLSLSRRGHGEEKHVGYWLFRRPAGYAIPQNRGGLYIAANVLLPIFISLLFAFAASSATAFFLLLLPVSDLVKSLLDFVLLHTHRPRTMPRLELKNGVPEAGRTLCAITCILSSCADAAELAKALERHYLCSRDCGENLLFALIADLPDTDSDTLPGSEVWLQAAADAVARLNAKYPASFLLLTRERTQSPDGRFMGYERKRGALLETMRLLRGKPSSIKCLAGDADRLQNIRFLLTLDSDTRLSPDSARELIGAMLHPLNRPVVDEKIGIVTQGHGVISPRMEPTLPSATESDFALVFAGQGGADPYCAPCGEVYSDMWDSGGFSGKGIIDIDAYLACLSQRLPEGRVLSHDAIEGAFLRGGYMGETQLLDGFPASPAAYYKRMHRWIRGDWQNIPWLFRAGRALPDIERFRLYDSLRRSLVPVMTFLAICAGFFSLKNGALIAAVAALLSCACQLLLTTARTLFQSDASLRFHSRVYSGIGGGLVRTVLSLILLPIEAVYCADAVLRALYRMSISGKNLLQWQTAGQSQSRSLSPLGCYRAMWPAAVLGLAIVLLSRRILGVAAGIIWLLSPLCAYFLGLPSKKPHPISGTDRAYLTECAREIWGYFDAFLTPEDNFLPPDNYQSRPPVGLAHRTSPTNIGLALLSVVSALDLSLSSPERCRRLIDGCLTTVERLEKWHGHLYNWYNTQTLEVLRPRYVSTVDSGNLCACLTALVQAASDLGWEDIARRARAILDEADFSVLYDERRRLFHIGIDTEKARSDRAWYDLLSGEARLTAYLAVARGDVPRSHWRALSRVQVAKNGYRGMASWTGTMFEYLMPELLLPLYGDSLLYESARFCLYAQKHRTPHALPWGVSESAFYSLDAAMNYRYKAHGCAALALKSGMDDELVVSPYSSFLALTVEPRAALKNLRCLDRLGMRGKYGFWEAIDFTPSRCREGRGDIVRCVMSHHLGMSMVAIANLLTDNAMPRRFMSDPAMSAYDLLLQEKLPLGGTVLRRSCAPTAPRPLRPFGEDWLRSGAPSGTLRPACCLLSGQTYSVMLTEYGHCRPLWGRVPPYVPAMDLLSPGHGVDLFLELDGDIFSLLPPVGETGAARTWEFTPESAAYHAVFDAFSSQMQLLLARDECAELRRVQLRFPSPHSLDGLSLPRLVLRFTPLLAEYKDYVNHPAFYKLGLSAKISRGCLIIRRLPRGRLPECFLCLACTRSGEFSNVPGLDTGRFSGERPITEDEFFLTEPYMQCAVEIRAEGAQIDCDFAIALAHSESDAIDCALSALSMTDSDAGDLPRRAACVMGMDKDAFASAWELLPELCFPTPPAENGDYRRGELWKFGVSGDLPILCAHCPTLDELDAARALLDSHLLITGSGTDFDLVLISHDGAAYRKPVNTALHELLWRNGGFALSGARGGVHVVDASDGVDALLSCACRVLDLSDSAVEVPLAESAPALPSMPNAVTARDCPYRWDEQERFAFSCSHALPPRVWANLLTNGRMGYLATDCGSGNMWYLNSRENPLSPWLCQPLASSGPEKLELEYAGERVSLFAGCHSDCRVTFDFGSATWDTRIGSATVETTAFIPPDRDARVLLIRCRGLEGAARIHWSLELDMSPAMPDGRYTLTRCENGVLRAENPRSIAQARALLATSYPAFDGFTCSKASVMSGSYDSRAGMQSRPVLSLTMSAGEEAVIVCSCGDAEETLALASAEFARRELERTRAHWRRCTDMLHLTSPSEELDRLANGWALYQALACRVLGRCSIYQSGGAFGFRDQLQDTVNLIPFLPKLAREQILRSCRRQYLEGDVQHWWHEGDGDIRGVRTRCSDDLLWLPWAVCEYVEKTGDRSILAEKTPYLSSPPLGDAEPDRYECACECETRESVLLHCRRALDMVLRRGTGEHGLLLFGSGDWNDGFDRVRGESQWLTWFFCHTAAAFAALSQAPDSALHYRVAELTDAANAAWDGDWFLRGYYADGKTLGSREDDECRIDSIAQSFAAFCPGADEEKLSRALKSAVDKLYDRRHGLVRLFAPPFTGSGADPGYIAAYGPGFRENGGQYTHAALWLVIALLRTGQPDAAWGLLRAMLPACRDSSTYQAEPFVIAADVYTAPGHTGQAGWSWYTGSSGWFLRTVTEELLGLKLRSGKLFIEPKLPTSWRGCKVIFHGRTIVIDGDTITVDGEKYTGGIEPFPLKTGDN